MFTFIIKKFSTYMSLGPIIFAPFNFSEAAIREIKFLCAVVNGEAIGSEYVCTDHHVSILPSQGRSHNTWMLFIPVGPKH